MAVEMPRFPYDNHILDDFHTFSSGSQSGVGIQSAFIKYQPGGHKEAKDTPNIDVGGYQEYFNHFHLIELDFDCRIAHVAKSSSSSSGNVGKRKISRTKSVVPKGASTLAPKVACSQNLEGVSFYTDSMVAVAATKAAAGQAKCNKHRKR